jgi:hypothetical protein
MLRICNRISNDSLKMCDIDRLYRYVEHFALSEVYLTYLILWELPLF